MLIDAYWSSFCCLIAWSGKLIRMFSGATGTPSIQLSISLFKDLLNTSASAPQIEAQSVNASQINSKQKRISISNWSLAKRIKEGCAAINPLSTVCAIRAVHDVRLFLEATRETSS